MGDTNKILFYVMEKYVGTWTPDGFETADHEVAKQELAFYRKAFPEYKWRLRKETRTVIWRRA